MYAVELTGIKKRFGSVTALTDVSFSVRHGEVLGLIGPSGCGKTTVLRTIAGLETPDSGRLRIRGIDAAGMAPADRRIGMVFQDLALWPHMNVRRHVEFVLKSVMPDRSVRGRRTTELLEMCRIEHRARSYPHELSGGERQRLAIARAMATNPEILLFDEPLTGLDAELRDTITDEILAMRESMNATMIFVSHRRDDIDAVADRTLFMRDGKTIGPLAVDDGDMNRGTEMMTI